MFLVSNVDMVVAISEAGGIGSFPALNYRPIEKYKETLQAAQKDPKKPLEIEKADTGKYYLRKGVYTFTLEKDGKTAVQEFTIE